MGKLDGMTALVTGGSRGIGRGIAVEMAREGANVVINYRRSDEAARETVDTIRSLGREAWAVQADVSEYEAVEGMVHEAIGKTGGFDILVANSGVASRPAPISSLDPKEWHRVIGTDLNGVFYTLRAGVPHLLEKKRGNVILVSSVGADLCSPFGAPYYAAKAGVNALGKTLAKELAPEKIRVNVVAPGWILSDMGERMSKALGEETMLQGIPLKRGGTPEEVGKLATWLASGDAAFVTGQIYRIDGGAWM